MAARYKIFSPNFGGINTIDEKWKFAAYGIKCSMTSFARSVIKKIEGSNLKEIQGTGVMQDITSFYATLDDVDCEMLKKLGFSCYVVNVWEEERYSED